MPAAWLAGQSVLALVLFSTSQRHSFELKMMPWKTMELIWVYNFFSPRCQRWSSRVLRVMEKKEQKQIDFDSIVCTQMVYRSKEFTQKTWHDSTNFSSCANFSFSFQFLIRIDCEIHIVYSRCICKIQRTFWLSIWSMNATKKMPSHSYVATVFFYGFIWFPGEWTSAVTTISLLFQFVDSAYFIVLV